MPAVQNLVTSTANVCARTDNVPDNDHASTNRYSSNNADRRAILPILFRENVKRYLVIKTVASLGTGVAPRERVDYPMLWGLLAFLLNYVPNIGSIIAAVPAVLSRRPAFRRAVVGRATSW